MLEHWSVLLVEDVRPNLYYEIRAHGQHVAIEGGMMKLAKSEPVTYHRFPFGMPVRKNVCGVEKLGMTKAADCALLPVSSKYTNPKAHLVKPLLRDSRDILAPSDIGLCNFVEGTVCDLRREVYGDGEYEARWVISYDVYRPDGEVLAGNDPVQVDEWRATSHRAPQAGVIGM